MGIQKIDDILYMDEIDEPALSRYPEDAHVEFRNVSFAYNTTTILKEVSFTANPGTVTALVGPSGAGKVPLPCLPLDFGISKTERF